MSRHSVNNKNAQPLIFFGGLLMRFLANLGLAFLAVVTVFAAAVSAIVIFAAVVP